MQTNLTACITLKLKFLYRLMNIDVLTNRKSYYETFFDGKGATSVIARNQSCSSYYYYYST